MFKRAEPELSDIEKLELVLTLNEEIEDRLTKLSWALVDVDLKKLGMSMTTYKQIVDWHTSASFGHSSLADEIKILWQARDRT